MPERVNGQQPSLCSQSINSIFASLPESNHDPLAQQKKKIRPMKCIDKSTSVR